MKLIPFFPIILEFSQPFIDWFFDFRKITISSLVEIILIIYSELGYNSLSPQEIEEFRNDLINYVKCNWNENSQDWINFIEEVRKSFNNVFIEWEELTRDTPSDFIIPKEVFWESLEKTRKSLSDSIIPLQYELARKAADLFVNRFDVTLEADVEKIKEISQFCVQFLRGVTKKEINLFCTFSLASLGDRMLINLGIL